MVYQSLEERMIHSYIETMPEFRMEKDATISEASCKEFYEFLSHMYQLFCEQPNLLFPTIYEDGSYTNRFNKSSDENPTLIMEMKNDIKVIEDFLVSLFLIGIESQLEDNRLIVARNHRILPKHKEILPLLGLQFEDRVLSSEIYPQIFPCWKWMATRKGASVFRFSRAMFDYDYSYASDLFAGFLGETGAFKELESYLTSHGYKRMEHYGTCYNIGYVNNTHITMDYVKKCTKTDLPPKSFVFDHNYIGISVEYSLIMEEPICLGLRIVRMKEILEKFSLMSDSLKKFIINQTKACTLCGDCRLGAIDKKPPGFVSVTYEEKKNLCPFFPGYHYCFTKLDHKLSLNIIELLSFIEEEIID